MTYLFTFVAGTGHVAYSVLPVIAEVATETKIRPERPLGIAVIASQQAITASPISAATVALLGLLAGFDVTLFDILKITIPATIIGVLVGALFSMKVGKELADDPEYRKRLTEGYLDVKKVEIKDIHNKRHAVLSVLIFILATVFIVFFGSFDSLRPDRRRDGETRHVRHYRNRDALCRRPHLAADSHRRHEGNARLRLPGRHAGGDCHIRHCLDGRYFSSGKHASVDPVRRGSGEANAVAVRDSLVCHVDSAL